MNADNIHHIFHRAAGLWRDRVMTVMMAVIWSERFLSTAVTKLSCEVHYQQSEQELKGLEECSSLFLLLCNSLISLSELTWRNKGDQVVKNKNWIRGVIALLKVEALPLSSKGQVWGYCWDFAARALNLTFVYLLRMWFFFPIFLFPSTVSDKSLDYHFSELSPAFDWSADSLGISVWSQHFHFNSFDVKQNLLNVAN